MEKLTYRQVVEDTMNYYSEDPNRRAISGNGCSYYDPETENCCAVGRYLKNPENFTIEEIGEMDSIGLFDLWLFEDIIKEEVIHLTDLDFWKELQKFHDGNSYWERTELSEAGLIYYQQLLELADKLDGQN